MIYLFAIIVAAIILWLIWSASEIEDIERDEDAEL